MLRSSVACMITTVVVAAAVARPAAAEPRRTTLGFGLRIEADGPDNPDTNELTYAPLSLTVARPLGDRVAWVSTFGAGFLFGDETTGTTLDATTGLALRIGHARFLGLRAELGGSHNRTAFKDSTCNSLGVLGRVAGEAGVGLGVRRRLVLSVGARVRKIVGYQCESQAWRSDRDANRGVAIGVHVEWRR